MPELPEVETIKNGIEKFIGKALIEEVRIFNRNFREVIPENFEACVCGAAITNYHRIGKYIIINLNNGNSIIWHLGMSGRIKSVTNALQPLEKHDHVFIKTSHGCLVFNDTRRFGILTSCPTTEILKQRYFLKIGIDPFDKDLTPQYLFDCLRTHKTFIKPTLLNQELITGIGNIYASEILFDCGISPLRPADKISLKECSKLILSIRYILQKAIDNGGSTLHDYIKPDGSLGYFQNLHCVYNKAGFCCPDCNCPTKESGRIQKIIQNGRSTFYCPEKQK